MSKITDIVEDLRNIENLTGSAKEVLVSGENIKTITYIKFSTTEGGKYKFCYQEPAPDIP